MIALALLFVLLGFLVWLFVATLAAAMHGHANRHQRGGMA